MEEKKIRTDFSKEGSKGLPKSIRFNSVQLQFIKEKEGLNTEQKCVDFLLSKYYFENKFGVNPITERSQSHENDNKIVDVKATVKTSHKYNDGEKSDMPDPKDKTAYLKWLRTH